MNDVIRDLFEANWFGAHTLSSIDSMRAQLEKNLQNQIDGFWSGCTAYYIMTKGGFLIDSKRGTKKELTALGEKFMNEMKGEQ